METLGYYNGEIAPLDELRIPMDDRACWFGDGVYDTACSANHIVFALEEHIERFFSSAALLCITPPLSRQALGELLRSLVLRVDSPGQMVYWQLTRGTAPRAHPFPENTAPNLWVTLRPMIVPDIYKKITLITVEDTRYLHCNIKTLNLLPNVMASEAAKQAGCEEAVFHRGERVTECAHSNVHILKDGVLYTAPADNLILPGIARTHIISHCRSLDIGVEEKPFTVSEMFAADEVFISSSGALCCSAGHIDGRPVGGKAPVLLRKLQDSLWEEFTQATTPR
jgi:D-alanine transaminase